MHVCLSRLRLEIRWLVEFDSRWFLFKLYGMLFQRGENLKLLFYQKIYIRMHVCSKSYKQVHDQSCIDKH